MPNDDHDIETVERIADAVRSAPTVSALTDRPFGAATCLPGRRVIGVRLGEDSIEVHVVGVYGHRVDDIARDVRRSVTAVAPGRRIDVVIEELA